jgi:hypothetical protein
MASFSLRGSLALWRRRKNTYTRLARQSLAAAQKAERKKDWKRRKAAYKWHRRWKSRVRQAENKIEQRQRQIKARENAQWGGARQVTNEIIGIVNGRAPVTSRKRWELFGNPSSDHYRGNKDADAVDFGIAEAHWLKNEISRRLGGPSELADGGTFVIVRGGKTFRVQIIAGTHGTGPHLHVGVKRIG